MNCKLQLGIELYAYHLLSTTKLYFVAVSLVYICLYVPYIGMIFNTEKESVAETLFVKQVTSQIQIGNGIMWCRFLEAKTRRGSRCLERRKYSH